MFIKPTYIGMIKIRLKQSKWREKIPGGLSAGKQPSDYPKEALKDGIKTELEHTSDSDIAVEIAMDHLEEDPEYYEKLSKMEKGVCEMKLIMESWRSYLIKEQQSTTAEEFVDKIKTGLLVIAAKEAGKDALKAVIEEIGPDAAKFGLELAKTIPGIGNAISGITAMFSGGKVALSTVKASAQVSKKVFDIMKIAAEDYVTADDSKISKGNPLAVLFNIDDKMEVPIKDEFLKNFAGVLLSRLQREPNMQIDNPEQFAEKMLANYINNNRYMKDAKPPQGE